jgi:cell division protein FtsL
MGLPARKIEHTAKPARRGGHLRVVRSARKPASSRRASSARTLARDRTLFMSAVVVLVAASALGLARVAVIARAAEMTISADQLMTDIKAERVEAGRLEVDRSSLSTPSRLASIASASMGMSAPTSVRYIKMPAVRPAVIDAAPNAPVSQATGEPGGVGAVLAALVDMSAGQAQSLLLGDVGLAGTR